MPARGPAASRMKRQVLPVLGRRTGASFRLALTSMVAGMYQLTLKLPGFTWRPSGRVKPGGMAGAAWMRAGTKSSGSMPP